MEHETISLFSFAEPDINSVEVNRLTMRVVDNSFAKDFMTENHYSKTCPQLYYALGFYHQGQIVCMVCFGPPSGRLLAQAVMANGNAQNVCELVRLFAFDWGPKNTESYAIGQSLSWLEKNAPDMRVVVSYADPNQGHIGTIYQATNWIYTGQGSRLVESFELFLNGEWIHPRSVFSVYGTTDIKKVEEQLGHSIEKRVCQHKHRYIYLLGNKRQKKQTREILKLPTLPYPKKDDAV